VLRWLFWRTLALASALAAAGALAALLSGLPGKALRGRASGAPGLAGLGRSLAAVPGAVASLLPGWLATVALGAAAASAASALAVSVLRLRARARREYVRVRVRAYRGDSAEPQALAQAFAALHAVLTVPWWRRLHAGQPSVAMEVHCSRTAGPCGERELWLAVCCPAGAVELVETALRSAYPNLQLDRCGQPIEMPAAVLRLRKHREFTRRTWTTDPRRIDRRAEPLMNALMTRMGACEAPAFTQIALTPAPPSLEWLGKRMYKAHEARLSRERREHAVMRDRSMVEDVELRGGLDVQHAALFFADIRVVAQCRADCRRIAAVLRARRAENRLVARTVALRPGSLGR
jgi:hypothetical protein